MAFVPTSSVVDWYIDFSVLNPGANNGSTPALAHNEIYYTEAFFYSDTNPMHRFWVRRGFARALEEDFLGLPSKQSHQIIKWPMPGERFYDQRPAAGIAAGWDNDPDIAPTIVVHSVNSDGFDWSDFEVFGIHFFACTPQGYTATGWASDPSKTVDDYVPNTLPDGFQFNAQETWNYLRSIFWGNFRNNHLYFNNCKFSSAPDVCLSIYFASGEGLVYILDECEVIQHTSLPDPATTVPPHSYCWYNGVFGTPSWYTPFTWQDFVPTVICRNTVFDGLFLNDPDSDEDMMYRSGLLICETGMKAEFHGCTFRNIGGRILGSYAGWPSSGYHQTVSAGFHTINLVGCTFENGEYDEPFNYITSWGNLTRTDRNSLWGHAGTASQYCSYPDDGHMNYGLNLYRCKGHPLSQRYVFDCFTYTLWETTNYPRPGGNAFQYIIQTSPDVGSYQTNSPNFYLITPEQTTWPCHDNFGAWTIPPDVGNPMTLTVYVKTLNWSVQPSPTDLFFLVHYFDGVTPTAQRAYSTQSVTQDNQWTALSVTFTPLWDAPLQCRLSLRCYEAGTPARQIILDPAIVVT